MSTKKVTRRKMVEHFGDDIYRYICDTLVNTAEHFNVLENSTDVKAIADFISDEVETALTQTLSSIKEDYWD